VSAPECSSSGAIPEELRDPELHMPPGIWGFSVLVQRRGMREIPANVSYATRMLPFPRELRGSSRWCPRGPHQHNVLHPATLGCTHRSHRQGGCAHQHQTNTNNRPRTLPAGSVPYMGQHEEHVRAARQRREKHSSCLWCRNRNRRAHDHIFCPRTNSLQSLHYTRQPKRHVRGTAGCKLEQGRWLMYTSTESPLLTCVYFASGQASQPAQKMAEGGSRYSARVRIEALRSQAPPGLFLQCVHASLSIQYISTQGSKGCSK